MFLSICCALKDAQHYPPFMLSVNMPHIPSPSTGESATGAFWVSEFTFRLLMQA